MKISVGHGRDGAVERLEKRGVSRRDFMKFCGTVAAVMGMGPAFAPKVAQALTSDNRPNVIWLHNAECTGCSESILRTVEPYIDALILDVISLNYHETIMAAAGEMAEKALVDTMKDPKGYVAVVEGAVPTAVAGVNNEPGAHGKVSGHTMLDTTVKVVKGAQATICYGTCATYGGVQAAAPNPTQAKGVSEVVPGAPIVNVPGCPPNPFNLVGTIVHYLTKGLPELDEVLRPVAFYGESVHDNCPRQEFFDNDQFAPSFGSEEARKGWCLRKLGCRGPETYNNCPTVKFNQINWPVQAGHPCIGCSEPGFWDGENWEGINYMYADLTEI
ncbi:hydrogenase small subunit [Pseudodesulfovibrio senegalensis]|uniref:cytochrome-c3 hydrogenase n=1 Tax=Pseudodesulfovibrio senegalensis TaxID=1721087 RepID=A0A6N6N3H4_9BACT|nr:hydrogenase small subunit [Pseudodesulfovibrio senegalensis]KAB1442262.1 hydrogenase small subunit [Pseudodesulfovibrio senegalensis]